MGAGVFIFKQPVKSCCGYCMSETEESYLESVPSKNSSRNQFLASLTLYLFFETRLIKNACSGSGENV